MRRSCLLLLGLGLTLATACGDDEDEASSDFERDCQAFCDAASSAGCGIDNCSAGCSYLEDQLGACVGAYGDLYACGAAGPVECVDGLPQPTTQDCLDESMALAECVQVQPCLDLCATADAAGCGGTPCVDRCVADEQASTFCSIEHSDLSDCQMENGVVCQGEAPVASEACSDLSAQFITCVASNDPCAAQCMSAELAGCGGESRQACMDACNAIVEGDLCPGEYQQLLECHGQNGLACNGAEVASTDACSSVQSSYDTCKTAGQ
jgi:hypothetical protein